MYTTNLAFFFDLIFLKMQTDVIIQQTQRNNDPPPAEPIALNSITLFLIILSLLKLWFEQTLVSTGVVSFDRKKTDITVKIWSSTNMSGLSAVQFCNIVNSCDVV